MNNVSVRPFLSGDEKAVASIHNVAFKEWIESLGIEYDYRCITAGDVSAWVKESFVKQETLWIAEMNNKAVGYAHCRMETVHAEEDFRQLLFVHTSLDMGQSKVAVIPSYRQRGVGKVLLQSCIDHFRRLGADVAVAVAYDDNRAAEELLRGLGFVHREFFYYEPYSTTEPWRYDTVYAELDLHKLTAPPLKLDLDIKIRLGREEDAEDVAEIFRKSAPWSPFGPNALPEQILSGYLRSPKSCETILVAEYEGKVVGVMDFNNDNNRLGIPGVLPRYRKRGIGYTLFYHLLKYMRQEGFSKAIADTGVILSDPIKMYMQFGFNIVRRQHTWIKVLHSKPQN